MVRKLLQGFSIVAVLLVVLASAAGAAQEIKVQLDYKGALLIPIDSHGIPVKIGVRTFKDVRENKSVAGRGATYSIFQVKGSNGQYGSETNVADFATNACMKDLQTLGFMPSPVTAPLSPAPVATGSAAATTLDPGAQAAVQNAPPAKEPPLNWMNSPVDSGIVVEGEIRHFFGETVVNTYFWPLVSNKATAKVVVCLRLFNAETGELVKEQVGEAECSASGNADKVSDQLNLAFALAMKRAYSDAMLSELSMRSEKAVAARIQTIEALRNTPLEAMFPAVDYTGVTAKELKTFARDEEWTASLHSLFDGFFKDRLTLDPGCEKSAESCSFSLQQPKFNADKALIVLLLPSGVGLDGFKNEFLTRYLPRIQMANPGYTHYGLTVKTAPDGKKLVEIMLAADQPAVSDEH